VRQGILLAWLFEHPESEASESELARTLGIARPTVHREIRAALVTGIAKSRRIGQARLVSINQSSTYYRPLRELMMRSFGVPFQVATMLKNIPGIDSAFIFGSWAARFSGVNGQRPIGDIDLLVLGDPDRSLLYSDSLSDLEKRIGYEVQVTIRSSDWIEHGDGGFHDTVVSRPMVQIDIGSGRVLDTKSGL
jgi:predicted nucleotidyltransferase